MPGFNQRLGFTRAEADDYYRRALEAYRKGQFDMAVDELSKAIEALPTRSEYYAARGLIYLEDGVMDRAEADFDAALKGFAYEMLAHYGKGMIAYQRKQWEAAQKHFQQAHFIDAARPEVMYYLALTYFHQNDRVNAANYMAQAHAGFEAANDKRKTDSSKWIKELEKSLARKPVVSTPELPRQQSFPMLDDGI